MLLRFASVRVMRNITRAQSLLKGQPCLERGICFLQINQKPTTLRIPTVYHQQYRFKRKGVKREKNVQDDESDSDISDDDDGDEGTVEPNSTDKYDVEPGSKIINYKMDNPRIDRLLRKALNISGKKVEELFYDKKIQVNDQVLKKKSQMVEVGDIITVPLEDAAGKPARGALVEILAVEESDDVCFVKVARNKNTLVKV